jgi:peptide/nickel transport system permease protein
MIKRDYLLKRIATTVVTLFFVLTINFLLFRLLPGDPIKVLFHDPRTTAAVQERLRIQFGLDKPVWEQYVIYVIQTLNGNLGFSFAYQRPVAEILFPRVLNTLILVIPMIVVAILLGIGLGVISAWRRKTKFDFSITATSLAFWSMPTFWLAIVMMLVFAVYFRAFPTSGMSTLGAVYTNPIDSTADLLYHLFLPLITMSLLWVGQFSLIIRNSMIDVLTEDYMLTAKAKGLRTWMIMKDYALRNSMLPMITLIGLNVGSVIAGDIQVESVFAWPGIGLLIFDSIAKRDYPLLQGAFLLSAAAMVIASLLADIFYAYVDPRIKY